MMLKRLEKIYMNPNKRLNLSSRNEKKLFNKNIEKNITDKNYYSSKSPMRDTKQKWEILKITQDNQNLLKRLIETKSCISCPKKIPISINSHGQSKPIFMTTSNDKFFNKKEQISSRTNNMHSSPSPKEKLKNRTAEDFFKFRKNNHMRRESSEINVEFIMNSENKKIILYERNAFINDLSIVHVEFILLDKKLGLVIDPISPFTEKQFVLEFESYESINLLKRAYKYYESIISDLKFDGKNLIISNSKAELIYRTKVVSKNKLRIDSNNLN